MAAWLSDWMEAGRVGRCWVAYTSIYLSLCLAPSSPPSSPFSILLSQALLAAGIVSERDKTEYRTTLDACARSGEWSPLLEFFPAAAAAAHSHHHHHHHSHHVKEHGGREGKGGTDSRYRKGEGRGRRGKEEGEG